MKELTIRKKKKILKQLISLLNETRNIDYNENKNTTDIPEWALKFKPTDLVLSDDEFALLLKILDESINNQKLFNVIIYDIFPIIIKVLSKIILSGSYIINDNK